MASASETANNSITDRNSEFNQYNIKRAALIEKIESCINGGTSGDDMLLIKGARREWWIIFVTSCKLIPNVPSPSTSHYDISIEGNGIHIVYDNSSVVYTQNYSASTWKTRCISNTQDVVHNVRKIEFYGKTATNKMTINNVIQKSTVPKADDIVDIEIIQITHFNKLCTEMATNSSFMNI